MVVIGLMETRLNSHPDRMDERKGDVRFAAFPYNFLKKSKGANYV